MFSSLSQVFSRTKLPEITFEQYSIILEGARHELTPNHEIGQHARKLIHLFVQNWREQSSLSKRINSIDFAHRAINIFERNKRYSAASDFATCVLHLLNLADQDPNSIETDRANLKEIAPIFLTRRIAANLNRNYFAAVDRDLNTIFENLPSLINAGSGITLLRSINGVLFPFGVEAQFDVFQRIAYPIRTLETYAKLLDQALNSFPYPQISFTEIRQEILQPLIATFIHILRKSSKNIQSLELKTKLSEIIAEYEDSAPARGTTSKDLAAEIKDCVLLGKAHSICGQTKDFQNRSIRAYRLGIELLQDPSWHEDYGSQFILPSQVAGLMAAVSLENQYLKVYKRNELPPQPSVEQVLMQIQDLRNLDKKDRNPYASPELYQIHLNRWKDAVLDKTTYENARMRVLNLEY